MEIFNDYTIDKMDKKGYALIPKREFNPEISAFSNFLLDLVDFKDRVRPMANDVARHDAAFIHQKRNVNEMEAAMREFKDGITEGSRPQDLGQASVDEGYSSLEIAAESELEDAADTEPEAAEPDLEAIVEDTVEEDDSEKKK